MVTIKIFATFRLVLDTSHFCSIAQKSETRTDKAGFKILVLSATISSPDTSVSLRVGQPSQQAFLMPQLDLLGCIEK